MKTNLLFTALGTLIISGSLQAAVPGQNIGYVDLQKAIQSTQAGRQAKDALAKEFEKKKGEVEQKQNDLKKMNDEFEKKSLVMNEKTRQEKQMEFQRKAMEFQQYVQESQVLMQNREKELTQPILEDMERLLREIAKEKQVSMILEKNRSAVLWAPDENDYTDLLIKKYETEKKKK